MNILVAKSEDQEHRQRQEGVNEIDKTYSKLRQIRPALPLFPIVKDVKATAGGDTITKLSVRVDEAVGESGEVAEEAENG